MVFLSGGYLDFQIFHIAPSKDCCASGLITVKHTYDACPKYSELGSFRIIAYLYVSNDSHR